MRACFYALLDISHWALPAMPDYSEASQDRFSDRNAYPFDSRGLVFSFAFFTPKGPTGSFYLMDIKDKAGEALRRQQDYRLTVPRTCL